MILKHWIYIALLGFTAYGAAGVLANTHLNSSPHDWQYYFYWSSPFILLLLAAKGWATSRMWRRMMDHRQATPTLGRTEYKIRNGAPRPSILEHACLLLVFLSLTAMWRMFV